MCSSDLPSHVLDYLAAHEVAHIVEMNHSPRFWRLVQRLCPGHGHAKAWLDVHGADLHRLLQAGPCIECQSRRPF